MVQNNDKKYKTIIIGGGASGMLAAIYAAEGGKTLVLERNNKPCKKIYASGNGRCNYLNTGAKDFELLKSELEAIGIFGAEEDEGRMYPRSREAASVAEALVSAAEKRGAEILCDCHISDILHTEKGFKLVSKDGRRFESEKLIIACGGKAGIQFGCYGEGYRWAQILGHKLVKPIPALVGMELAEDISELHGVRCAAKARIKQNGSVLAEDAGELQFTKDSISGICIMNLSRWVRLAENTVFDLSIDLFPEYSEEALKGLLKVELKASGNAFASLLPSKLAAYIVKLCPDASDTDKLAGLVKNISFRVTGTKGWTDAQVTSGGVALDEVDNESFESLIVPGLYFAGEILDYDGPCGGYNLSFAFRSGMMAGRAAAK